MGVTRVVWKPDERQALAERAALLMFKGEAGSPLQAINAAQIILDESRRREVVSVGPKATPWFRPLLVQELAKLRLHAEQQEAQAAKAAADEAAEKAAARAEAAPKKTAEALAAKDVEHAQAAAQAAAMQFTAKPKPAHQDERTAKPTTELGQAFLHLRSAVVDELASIIVEAVLKAIGSTQPLPAGMGLVGSA